MEKYTVNITQKALSDIGEIYKYIFEKLQAPIAATRQYDRIAETIKSLEVCPKRIKVMDSEDGNKMRLRQIRVDNYSVFFVIKNEIVNVIRVLYSASDTQSRLENL